MSEQKTETPAAMLDAATSAAVRHRLEPSLAEIVLGDENLFAIARSEIQAGFEAAGVPALIAERDKLAARLRAYEETAEHYCAADTPISADGIRGHIQAQAARIAELEAGIHSAWLKLEPEAHPVADDLEAFIVSYEPAQARTEASE